jgi:hypothetical protein
MSTEQEEPVNNSSMLKDPGNSELLTFTDSDFASCVWYKTLSTQGILQFRIQEIATEDF